MSSFLKLLLHLIITVLLTVLTQIGGLIYLISILGFRRKARRTKFIYFTLIYFFTAYVIIPFVAPVFGREKIKNTNYLQPRSFFYTLTNRNYVTPELNKILTEVSERFEKKHDGIKVVYLDANFPFFDKFSLLPHLSHNDGKKIDLTLMYKNEKGELTNRKPSISGYGVYEKPTTREYNQIDVCKRKGNWQYDFPKYLTFGRINRDVKFSNQANKELINLFLQHNQMGKIFIEPHLKNRLKLNNAKVRFHGCQAVRHDDHIHLQLR